MKDKANMCNRSITMKLENCTLNFVFSDKQNRAFLRTSFEHLHSNFELHFIIKGSCRLCARDVDEILTENTVVLIPPRTPHCITDYSPGCKKVDVRVSVLDDEHEDSLPFFGGDRINVLHDMTRIVCYADDFYEAMSLSGRDGEMITRSALTMMYFSLLRELGCDDSDEGFKHSSGVSYDYVIIEDHIMQNYMSPFTLKQLADKTGFSPTHIGRVIKKNYGMSYSDLILTLRMSHAKKLLDDGASAADIYKMVGYSSYNGFALAFKRYYKISPEQMRKSK